MHSLAHFAPSVTPGSRLLLGGETQSIQKRREVAPYRDLRQRTDLNIIGPWAVLLLLMNREKENPSALIGHAAFLC